MPPEKQDSTKHPEHIRWKLTRIGVKLVALWHITIIGIIPGAYPYTKKGIWLAYFVAALLTVAVLHSIFSKKNRKPLIGVAGLLSYACWLSLVIYQGIGMEPSKIPLLYSGFWGFVLFFAAMMQVTHK